MRVVRVVRYAVAALPLLFAATSAQAHVGHDVTGFVSGFVHPLGGLDHILAMVAIGLWAGQLGGRGGQLVDEGPQLGLRPRVGIVGQPLLGPLTQLLEVDRRRVARLMPGVVHPVILRDARRAEPSGGADRDLTVCPTGTGRSGPSPRR